MEQSKKREVCNTWIALVYVHGIHQQPPATGDYMNPFIHVVGLTGTIDILRYLKEHEIVTYTELAQFSSVSTLNKRLNQLVNFKLIEHHFEKKNRREWYTITEKGKEALSLIEKLILLTA